MSRPHLTEVRETLIGAVVMTALAILLVINAADSGEDERINGYVVSASFQRADGVSIGAPVRMAGMPVGEVIAHTLANGYRAELSMRLNSGVEVPADSAAVIETDGLLGPKYIEIHPGGEDTIIRPGGRFEYAQDAMVLEDLLLRIVEQAKAKAQERDRAAPQPPQATDDPDGLESGGPESMEQRPGGAASPVPSLVPSLQDLLKKGTETEEGDQMLEHLPKTGPDATIPPPEHSQTPRG